MLPHLPALQVVVPLLAAPLCVVLRRTAVAYGLAFLASWAAFAISVLLLLQVLDSPGGVISYELGGWAPPWGIEYRIDPLNAYVMLIVAAIGAVVITYAGPSVAREIAEPQRYLFYTSYLLCLSGLLGVTVTGDAFNVFVFLEISSLSSYILISVGATPKALTAAYRYLIFGTIGATFYLIGVGLLYQMTGTLNMADLAQRVPPLAGNRTILVAFAFIAVGVGMKAALFPLHIWLPNAYAYAPSVVSAFLAATATKVAVYVLIRVYLTIFGAEFSIAGMGIGYVFMPFAIAAMFVGSAVAIFQPDVKRMLAYSSVAQIGYIVLGFGIATALGVTAGILHLFNHALMKGSMFLALGCVFYRTGAVTIESMHGLAGRMPWTTAAFVGGGLGIIGVPLTAGFISKWYLVTAALERGWWWLAALILLSSLLAIVYVWRVVEAAYFRPAPAGAPAGEAPFPMLVATWALVAANVYFGLDTRLSVGVAERAAAALMGGGP
ncbi:MAG: monovalent cation/H+ antiporter subunit D family protein [Alphaproteobacteria bacterium]|nr:monovalent cation/H+ antiporter subunit D family protein [Alphaproteobacteria bacterium]